MAIYKVFKFFISLLVLSIIPAVSFAEDLPDIDSQLSETTAEVEILEDPDLFKANEDLLAEEAELLNKISESTGEAFKETQEEVTEVAETAEPVENTEVTFKTVVFEDDGAPVEEQKVEEVTPVDTETLDKLNTLVESNNELKTNNTSLNSKLSRSEKSLKNSRMESKKLRARIADKDDEIKKLVKKLKDLEKKLRLKTDKLTRAEAEISELSEIIARNQNIQQVQVSGNYYAATRKSQGSTGMRQLPVATVNADKIYLRTGPSEADSPLMAVTKGTRLRVEKRNGEWLRVITPAGTRAWVKRELIRFGKDEVSSPSATVKIK